MSNGAGQKIICFWGVRQVEQRQAYTSVLSDQHLSYAPIRKHHIYTCYKQALNFLASLCS